jgi:hypothetical protein
MRSFVRMRMVMDGHLRFYVHVRARLSVLVCVCVLACVCLNVREICMITMLRVNLRNLLYVCASV